MAESINDLKAEISKRNGLARTNRFRVIMTPPSQALIDIDLGQIVTGFRNGGFDKGQLINDPRSLQFLCESASIPGSSIAAIEHTLTGGYPQKRAVTRAFDKVDFSFYVTNDFYVRRMFDDWINMIIADDYTLTYHEEYVCDVTIQQLDINDKPIYGVQLINAFPTSVGALQLTNAAGGETKMTVSMEFDRYKEQSGIGSTFGAIRNAIPKRLI
tara:strand:+ start:677 stop:1318 length:642 start_codon:yes stop_codon:yes gene_type:complete